MKRLLLMSLVIGMLYPYKGDCQISKELKIGDKVPDVFFKQIFNSNVKSAKLSDFKGKLIILDFWNSGCKACVAAFPHMQELQDKFNGKIQIFLVNSTGSGFNDSPTNTRPFLERFKKLGTEIKLPILFDYKILDQYFPHVFDPHEVWIDGDGKILAITAGNDVSDGNISKVLSGNPKSMLVKKDKVGFNYKAIILEPDANFLYRSSFAEINGLFPGKGQWIDSLTKVVGTYRVDRPLLSIIMEAYGGLRENRIVVETGKPSVLHKESALDSLTRKKITYESVVPMRASPKETNNEILQSMREDLRRAFGIVVKIETRTIKCFVLKIDSSKQNSFVGSGKYEIVLDYDNIDNHMQNAKLPDLVSMFNEHFFRSPFIDETGLSTAINLKLPKKPTQENLILTLENAGFKVEEVTRAMEVAIIKN